MLADSRALIGLEMSQDEHVTCEPADKSAGKQHPNPLISSSLTGKLLTDWQPLFTKCSPVKKKKYLRINFLI